MTRHAALALALALLALGLPGAGAAHLPCDVVEPVDRLLSCPERAAGPQPPPAPGRSASDDGGGSPTSDQPRWRPLAGAETDPTRLLVRVRAGVSRTEAAGIAENAGATLERLLVPLRLAVVRAEPAELDDVRRKLARTEGVQAVHGEQRLGVTAVRPNDTHWPEQTGLQHARFPEAWQTARGSPQAVVAVVDTGVDAGHPDLAGALLRGRDLVNGDDDATDDHGHGTAVAGVIAARGNNATGIAGACWSCSILPVKALAADGTGPTSAVAAGVLWATDHGAQVINLSLGSPASTAILAEAVAYATSRGVTVVAAAGNDGVDSRFYPAAEAGVLAIAAVDDSDQPYSWSNRGAWVQVAAPGCLPTTLPGGGYGTACGTSIAAPVVSGLAALLRAAHPALPAPEIAELIRRSAVPIGSVVQDGRLDAAAALATLTPVQAQPATLTIRSSLTRARRTRAFTVAGGEGTWTAALESGQRGILVLTVRSQSGAVLTRVRGRPPLRLVRRLPAGHYSIQVGGVAGRFVLRVRRPASGGALTTAGVAAAAAPGDRTVRLSYIPRLAARAEATVSLGRPALEGDRSTVFALPAITDPEAIEDELAAAINQLRRSHGLNALTTSSRLADAADAHARSLALAGAFTHRWPLTPRAAFGRWIQRYYPPRSGHAWHVGENLLWSGDSVDPAHAVSLWLNSPSHRRVMLGLEWRELAIGVVRAERAGGVFAGRAVYLVAAEFGAR
jgi:subtilisin family serine protease/uncharacterized protein YkwD